MMFYTYIFQFIVYNILLDLPEGAPLVNELGGAGMASYLDVFFSHVMVDNLDEAPVAAKNGLIFGACILAACLSTAYIQYTAPNLGIFL